MKLKTILAAIIGLGAISLSHFASATSWVPGPCSPPGYVGPPPCIETTISGQTWHFNGDGSHAGSWHGSPLGGDLVFSGSSVLGCSGLDLNCQLTLRGQVKKCLDSNNQWRIGIRVNSYAVSGFGCGTVALSGFPWYSKDATITPHCPFGDVCENFNTYVPNAVNYTANMGQINISVFSIPRVTNGHVHNVLFTPGVNARFNFNSEFYNCSEAGLGCTVVGELIYNGNVGDSLFVR